MREIYELESKVTQSCYLSDSVYMVAASFHPNYPALFSEMANKHVNVNAIFSKDVLDSLQKNYFTFLEEIIKGESFNIFVYSGQLDFVSLVVNDHYILLRALKNSDGIDGQYIVCSNPNALQWGKDLFEHYMKDSVPLNEI